jgi:predicted nucleic acid-binding protein
MTKPKLGGVSMEEATAMLARLAREPGYQYQPISADWQTLCGIFFKRLFGHNQITDAYLLGVAVREGLVLATFDRAILHLAGEHANQVFILEAK